MYSIDYWKNRYDTGGNSGEGSRGDLLLFKASFINGFFKDKGIKSILDFGHGDLMVASKLVVDEYTGLDIIKKDVPQDKSSKNMILIQTRFDEVSLDKTFDCTMCLDVLYHILKDEEIYLQKTMDNIIKYSKKYIIIYAQDSYNKVHDNYSSCKIMNNVQWRQYFSNVGMRCIFEQKECEKGTSAKFFIYEK